MLQVTQRLKKKGLVTGEEEVSEYGASLVDIVSRIPKLLDLKKMDEELYSAVENALKLINNGRKHAASTDVRRVAEIMKVRYFLGHLLEDPDTDAYDSLSRTLTEYSNALSHYNTFHTKEKKYIVNDLKRDLGALLEYTKVKRFTSRGTVLVEYEPKKKYFKIRQMNPKVIGYYKLSPSSHQQYLLQYGGSRSETVDSNVSYKRPMIQVKVPYSTPR